MKSLEAQHDLLIQRSEGYYSFSHLTFQEYFTARNYIDTHTLQELSRHITEKRWREVFLLAVEMLRPANDLLKAMKDEVDKILAGDKKLQVFLAWVQEKSESVKASYKPAAIRAFYFALDRARARETDDNKLEQAIGILRDELPDPKCDFATRKEWWKSNGANWLERLRQVTIKHQNIGHD